MERQEAPVWLQPVHRWFFFWEDMVPSVSRVVAVTIGAAITSVVVVVTTKIKGLVTVPLATVGWIALGVAQEHDARVHLGVDGEFLDLLRDQVDPVLARAGFTFNSAFGPCRARPGRSDTFLYEAADPNGNGCIDVWIRRDRFDGKMEVSVDGHRLERLVALSGDPQCATRVTQAEEPVGDAAALVAAFGRVLP